VLERVSWNRAEAARILKVSYKTLAYEDRRVRPDATSSLTGLIGGGSWQTFSSSCRVTSPSQYLYLKHVFADEAGTWSLIDEEANGAGASGRCWRSDAMVLSGAAAT